MSITSKILLLNYEYTGRKISAEQYVNAHEEILKNVLEKLIKHVIRNYSFEALPMDLLEYLTMSINFCDELKKEYLRVTGRVDDCETMMSTLSRVINTREELRIIYQRFWEYITAVESKNPRKIVLASDALIHTTHTFSPRDLNVLDEDVKKERERVEKILKK